MGPVLEDTAPSEDPSGGHWQEVSHLAQSCIVLITSIYVESQPLGQGLYGCSHFFSPADSGPQMCLVWPPESVFKILNQLPTFSVQEIYVKTQAQLSFSWSLVWWGLWLLCYGSDLFARNEEKCNSWTAHRRGKQVDAILAPLFDFYLPVIGLG